MFNLIENAIKFNKPGGGVYVAVSQKGDDFEFIVKDNGPRYRENRTGTAAIQQRRDSAIRW